MAFDDAVPVFTRSGSATRVGPAGTLEGVSEDVPRMGHDAATGRPLGLMIEPARENQFTRSADLSHADWTKTRVTITADDALGPFGTATMDKVVDDGSAGAHRVGQSFDVVSGERYTMSTYARADDLHWVYLTLGSTGFPGPPAAWFDLSAGAVGTVVAGGAGVDATAAIRDAGDGLYRIEMSATCTNSASAQEAAIGIATADAEASHDGPAGLGLHLEALQFEAGHGATSHIPTVAESVARGADTAAVEDVTTAIDVENRRIAGPAQGRTAPQLPEPGEAAVMFQIDDGTDDNRVRVDWYNDAGTGRIRLVVTTAGEEQAAILAGVVEPDTDFAVAFRAAADDCAIVVAGAAVQADTSATMPAGLNRLRLGRSASGEHWRSTIAKVPLLCATLDDDQLVEWVS